MSKGVEGENKEVFKMHILLQVYGWGGSKYGQVGVGTRHIYRRPMLLETLQSETTVAVECGHYHSLALTADNQ